MFGTGPLSVPLSQAVATYSTGLRPELKASCGIYCSTKSIQGAPDLQLWFLPSREGSSCSLGLITFPYSGAVTRRDLVAQNINTSWLREATEDSDSSKEGFTIMIGLLHPQV